jgi:putative transposase
MLGWAKDFKVGLVHIQPGRPMQNGHVESFHGRLRDECLNANWFRTLNDVRSTLASWRREYNCERPRSLDYDGCEIISKQNQNRETPVISG